MDLQNSNNDNENSSSKFHWRGIIVILSIVIIGNYISPNRDESTSVLQDELTTVSGTFIGPVKISGGHKSSYHAKFTLNEWPNITFDISGTEYKSLKKANPITEINNGDTLYLSIAKRDKELLQSISKWNLPVYEMRGTAYTYLELEDVNSNRSFNRQLGRWIMGTLSLFVIIYMIMEFGGHLRKLRKWVNKLQSDQ